MANLYLIKMQIESRHCKEPGWLWEGKMNARWVGGRDCERHPSCRKATWGPNTGSPTAPLPMKNPAPGHCLTVAWAPTGSPPLLPQGPGAKHGLPSPHGWLPGCPVLCLACLCPWQEGSPWAAGDKAGDRERWGAQIHVSWPVGHSLEGG